MMGTFVARQRRCRVVVGVDDAHLLGGLSALVVHQLAQSGGVRLVVTVRTGSHQPDPAGLRQLVHHQGRQSVQQ
ncbi:hypothetical protein, partial [Mycobacterium avium]|uniref:hypothetical protein n=1 Tax=Mycobacterium avium TaxID=1764 RepID=UPI003F667184